MRATTHRLFLTACIVALSPSIYAQLTAPTNLLNNGGFEKFSVEDNTWDGVDSEGYLVGTRRNVSALTESGAVTGMAMPISPCVVDINGDGLLDIIAADPLGYVRTYINSGSKTEPKFTHAEVLPLFLSRFSTDQALSEWRMAPRINLFDWGKRGVLDMIVGNSAGEIYFLPNKGTARVPDFSQITAASIIPTGNGGALWGNLFSPAVADWNKDGKPDLLVGEGSYSANAVHLLLNIGSGVAPKFSPIARHYLAYGDGREQLMPTIADVNGDGFPDLLVGDRKGTIGIYLHPGALWKPGVEFKFAQFLTIGSAPDFGGPVAPYAADLNGDGLFDLVLGKNNGRIAVAYNRGSNGKPDFGDAVDLKGVDLWGRTIHPPSGWKTEDGFEEANFYAYWTVVSAEEDKNAVPPEGTHVLKAGYFASPNLVFKKPMPLLPGKDPSNHININEGGPNLKVGKSYEISFKVKGAGAKDGTWEFKYSGSSELVPAKVERGDRGSARLIKAEVVKEKPTEKGTFSAGANWTTVTKTFTVKFTRKELKPLIETSGCDFSLALTLAPYDGVFYVDDVRLIEKN